MSSSEDNCAQNCCNNCTESFCQSCTESCSESCETSCENACNQACQNACANATCTCGSDTTTELIMFISTLILPLIGAIILGIFHAFDSRSPIFLTLLGSSVLAINLTGIQIGRKHSYSSCNVRNNSEIRRYKTYFGRLVINHSHHPRHLILRGHEFKLKNKYFCTGCYGILIGTLFSIIITSFYLIYGFDSTIAGWFVILAPFCFLPILFRYSLDYEFPTYLRLIANSLLPLGGCLLLIGVDVLYQNWHLNVMIVLLIVFSAYFRGFVVRKEKK